LKKRACAVESGAFQCFQSLRKRRERKRKARIGDIARVQAATQGKGKEGGRTTNKEGGEKEKITPSCFTFLFSFVSTQGKKGKKSTKKKGGGAGRVGKKERKEKIGEVWNWAPYQRRKGYKKKKKGRGEKEREENPGSCVFPFPSNKGARGGGK